jgi:hypothetical protein
VPSVTLEYAAIYYLNWWLDKDRRFCAALAGDDRALKMKALREAASVYGVARNLPTRHDTGLGLSRMEPLLEVVSNVEHVPLRDRELIDALLAVRDKIAEAYGQDNLLSLTTKLLWLKFKRPVVIYDGNCRRALGTRVGDLPSYYQEWRSSFARSSDEIRDVCKDLAGLSKFTITGADPGNEQAIENVAREQWFHERVHDIYLWFDGAPQGAGGVRDS